MMDSLIIQLNQDRESRCSSGETLTRDEQADTVSEKVTEQCQETLTTSPGVCDSQESRSQTIIISAAAHELRSRRSHLGLIMAASLRCVVVISVYLDKGGH